MSIFKNEVNFQEGKCCKNKPLTRTGNVKRSSEGWGKIISEGNLILEEVVVWVKTIRKSGLGYTWKEPLKLFKNNRQFKVKIKEHGDLVF